MSRTDRAVRRANRHLRRDETLVASAVGYEVDGRRRQVVLLTNRRIVVTGLRDDPSLDLPLVGTSVTYDRDRHHLVLHHEGEAAAVLRDVEAGSARQIAALLEDHRSMPESASAPRVQHVHLRPPDADR